MSEMQFGLGLWGCDFMNGLQVILFAFVDSDVFTFFFPNSPNMQITNISVNCHLLIYNQLLLSLLFLLHSVAMSGCVLLQGVEPWDIGTVITPPPQFKSGSEVRYLHLTHTD